MVLGEKLRQARLEAGLSQRQLCGEEITRNMLSLIENGSASPSMKTLQYLAGRLGKSVGYFLEEGTAISPNQALMLQLRQQFDRGEYAGAAQTLEQYQGPDVVFDREKSLLQALTYLELAQQALSENRQPYALELLEKSRVPVSYCTGDIERRRLLLLGQLSGQKVAAKLPSLDEELLLRASEALEEGNPIRAAQLLDAAEHPQPSRWFLRGEACLRQKQYAEALRWFHMAEGLFPQKTAPKLEQCYRELGDYKQAYEYACKQK